MQKDYDNTNRGILFQNDRKESDKHPDMKGSINVGGKEFRLSAWNKDTSKGPAISISIQAKDDAKQGAAKAAAAKAEVAKSAPADFADDDIPF